MFKSFVNLFFPNQCASCSELLLEREEVICVTCRHQLPITNDLLNIENSTYKKFYGRLPLEHASAMLYFHKKGIVQQLIHHLKYKKQQQIGTVLGKWYALELKEVEALKTVNFIIPVPLHPKKLKQRGYNQVLSFSKAIADALQIELNQEILTRNIYNTTQSKKDLIHRNLISKKAFSCNNTAYLENNHFLLIDDVLTTGATIEACGKELLKIPGSKLSVVTIAFTQS